MQSNKNGLELITESHIAAIEQDFDIKNIMSQEDYLETIYMLSKNDTAIKSVDIAKAMGVSRPAVNVATDKLIEKGFIKKDRYSYIEITEKGKKAGEEIYKKHVAIMEFLLALGCSQETALLDCCKIEHVISEETLSKMKDFTKKHKNK